MIYYSPRSIFQYWYCTHLYFKDKFSIDCLFFFLFFFSVLQDQARHRLVDASHRIHCCCWNYYKTNQHSCSVPNLSCLWLWEGCRQRQRQTTTFAFYETKVMANTDKSLLDIHCVCHWNLFICSQCIYFRPAINHLWALKMPLKTRALLPHLNHRTSRLCCMSVKGIDILLSLLLYLAAALCTRYIIWW